MVQVDEVDLFKLGESDRNKMAEILADIPDYCTVVFTYETTPWKPDKRLKKLWEAIDGAGLIVEFAKQDQKDLAAWSQGILWRGTNGFPQICACTSLTSPAAL